MPKETYFYKTLLLACACMILLYWSLLIGDFSFSTQTLWLTLIGKGTALQQFIIFHMRLTHVVNTFIIGCVLALSGYLMQVLLSNPLADPYTLGTSGGAAFFTLVGWIIGFQGYWIVGCSFFGCIVSIVLLRLAVGSLKKVSSSQLLLVGVVMAAGWGALLSLLLIILPFYQTKPILYWLFGEIDSQQSPVFALGCLALSLIGCWRCRKELILLKQGPLVAKTLGLDINKLQFKLIIMSSFLTAVAVSMGGTIGFIGLMVPHITRMLLRTNRFWLFPGMLFIGGGMLLFADLLSRTIISPDQLPVGILTTLIGIPFFLFLTKEQDK